MILRDNVYGTIEEDAFRRDFTINALYYNIEDFSVIDYAGGMADLRAGTLRLIGDPETRYREDPVRMLRAVRFAAKLGFLIAPECEAPIHDLGHLIQAVPPARLFEEVLKLFLAGYAVQGFEKLRHYDLFEELFPATDEALSHEDHEFPITFVLQALQNTDDRVREGKPVTPIFLFAALLWEPVRQRYDELLESGEMPPYPAMEQAASEILAEQARHVAIPKRFSLPMRELWSLQHRFEQRSGKRPFSLLSHPRFRAAYDFLLLRAAAGEVDAELAAWWTRFQEVDGGERGKMISGEGSAPPRKRRRRRRKKPAGDGE